MKLKQSFILLFTVFTASTLFTSCYYDKEEYLYGTGCPTAAASPSFASDIEPILSANCYGCHNTSNAPTLGASIDLQGYTNLKAYISSNSGTFSSSINQDGSATAMPKGGSKMSTCNLTLIQNWISSGMLNN